MFFKLTFVVKLFHFIHFRFQNISASSRFSFCMLGGARTHGLRPARQVLVVPLR